MPVTPAFGFHQPDSNAVIWRYIDLAKFISMLETESLHLARSDRVGDPFEGSVPHELVTRRTEPESTWQAKIFGPYVAERYQGARGYMFVNCWNLSERESAALWPLYVPSDQGVAIRSTCSRLVAALAKEEKALHIGRVRYIDYATETFPPHEPMNENVLTPFIHKRKSFEHEQELRIVWWDGEALNTNMGSHIPGEPMPAKYLEGVHPDGIRACLDLPALIQEVRVSPAAPLWFSEVVAQVVARYRLSFPVGTSDLLVDPVY